MNPIDELKQRYGAVIMSYEFIIPPTDDGWFGFVSGMTDIREGSNDTLKVVVTVSQGNGKWGMARLWRSWMKITADYMAANGAKMPLMTREDGSWYGSRPFNEKDAHELFTAQWLGVDENGNRLSWKKSEGENVADKGQRFIAMMRHQDWCIEKGIALPKPRNSELHELEQSQNM